MWLIIIDVLDEVHLDFMIAGHTFFFPDACFGCLKKKVRKERILNYDDFHAVVEKSAKCNLAVSTRVPSFRTYDWKTFVKQFFRPVDKISKLHCLEISRGHVIACEVHGDGKPTRQNLMKRGITEEKIRNPSDHGLRRLEDLDTSSRVVLDDKRVDYLKKKILPYIGDSDSDKLDALTKELPQLRTAVGVPAVAVEEAAAADATGTE